MENGKNDNIKPKAHCHKCAYEWDTISDRYRLTCPSCGAWVINPNAKYKPSE